MYQRVLGLSGGSEANADCEADDPADGDEDQRGAHRDAEEAVPDPSDREKLDEYFTSVGLTNGVKIKWLERPWQ